MASQSQIAMIEGITIFRGSNMPVSVVSPFEFEDDHQSFILNFTGGIKAWQRDKDQWSFGPIVYKGEPVVAGILSESELRSAVAKMGILPIILEHRTSMNGNVTTMWRSVHPATPGDSMSATDIWRTISGNLTRSRMSKFGIDFPEASAKETFAELENHAAEERLSDYISESLRSMDICIGSICNYYHDQLVGFLREGKKVNQQSSNVADLPFIANVHSFFVHLGAARDYLAALIAHRCGLPERVDGMNRLLDEIRWEKLPSDAILNHLVQTGCLASKENSSKTKLNGWLNYVSSARNELVHKRPYGSLQGEKYGHIESAGQIKDHYKFFKPIFLNGVAAGDTLDFISDAYHKTMKLFGEIALVSGSDIKIQTISGSDVISFKVTTGKPPKDQ